MATPEQFSRRMLRRAKMVRIGVDRAVVKATNRILESVVHSTPIDTGRAKANWAIGIGSKHSTTFLAPPTPSAAESVSLTRAAIKLAGYKGGEGMQIHISNNLDYIADLNRGKSIQAAPGFFEAAVLEGALLIRNTKVFVRI
jgi:hypothetical protein